MLTLKGRRLRLALVAAALAVGSPGVIAAVSVSLSDGQVVKGSEVRRDGDNYLVTMAGGAVVAFPAALVASISFEDEPAPKAPPGFDYSGPRTLAGPEKLPSQDPKDQLKVMGPPSRWAPNPVDTTWTPTNAYDTSKDVLAGSRTRWSENVVDTTWVPVDAYAGRPDASLGHETRWSRNAVDTTWTPTDGFGFKPLSWSTPAPPERYPLSFTPEEDVASLTPAPAAPAAAPSGPTPWSCGETLLATASGAGGERQRAGSITVKPVRKAEFAALGVPLYEAEAKGGPAPRKAIFTIGGGSCRLVGGDAGALIGLNLSPDVTMAQDVASFNAAVAAGGGAKLPTGVDALDFAYALVTLTDPRVSGSSPTVLTLVAKPEELRSIASTESPGCSASRSARKRQARAAPSLFSLPKIASAPEGTVATFLTWSSAGGTLHRNTVVLTRDGLVTVKRDAVATHLGAHFD